MDRTLAVQQLKQSLGFDILDRIYVNSLSEPVSKSDRQLLLNIYGVHATTFEKWLETKDLSPELKTRINRLIRFVKDDIANDRSDNDVLLHWIVQCEEIPAVYNKLIDSIAC